MDEERGCKTAEVIGVAGGPRNARLVGIVDHESSAISQRRGKWSDPGVPHKGWNCLDVEDLGAPDLTCEMCESADVRFVHVMTHPSYPTTLRVGCICSGHMSDDLVGAERRDESMRSRASKKNRWLSRKWRVSAKGNPWLRSDGFRVVIFPNGNQWQVQVAVDATGFKKTSTVAFATSDQAKLAAFDFITWLQTHRDKWS